MKNYFFRILIISVLLFQGKLIIFAQPGNQSIFSIGTKYGINFSQIIFDPIVTQDLTIGNNYGLVIKYVSETHVGIQMELNYSERGWTEKLETGNAYKRTLDYLEVPILTHFIFFKKKTRAFLNVGPSLSYHIGGKEEFHLTSVGDTLPYYNLKLNKDFELGLVGGVGITRLTSIGDFQLEFRFLYGLQSIFESNSQTNLLKSQNQLYGITFSYFFFKKDFRAKKSESAEP